MIAKQTKQSADNLLAGYSRNNLPGRVDLHGDSKTFRGFVERESSGFRRVLLHVRIRYNLEVSLTWQCNTASSDYSKAGEWYGLYLEARYPFTNIVGQLGEVKAFAARLEKGLLPGQDIQPEEVVGALGKIGYGEVVHDDRLSEWVLVDDVLPAEYTGWATGYSVEAGKLWARAIARDKQAAQAAILMQVAEYGTLSYRADDWQEKGKRWLSNGMPVVPYGGVASLSIVAQLAAHRAVYSLPGWEEVQKVKAEKALLEGNRA
jgi:hypothetical protein